MTKLGRISLARIDDLKKLSKERREITLTTKPSATVKLLLAEVHEDVQRAKTYINTVVKHCFSEKEDVVDGVALRLKIYGK